MPYAGDRLNRIAFPLGGLGAGMVCLEGTGAFSHVSLRHQPDVFNSPLMFAALGVKGHPELARVLEAPVPEWKLFGGPGTANGAGGTSYGLPRLASGTFLARFPFAMAVMRDRRPPLEVTLTGWSPFEPNDPDGSSLPVAGLEYRIVNRGRTRLDAVFSFHARNFMGARDKPQAVRALDGGFELWGGADKDKPWEDGSFAVVVDEPGTTVDHAWFRGGWWDPLTLTWKAVTDAATVARPPVTEGQPAPGGSLFVPVTLEPGASRTIRVKLAWYVPLSHLRSGKDPAGAASDPDKGYFRAWYAGRFASLGALVAHWRTEYDALRARSLRFSECLHDTTLPPEVTEAVAANLSILKSPTVLRQDDGRMWAWEGCSDASGCCHGTCTHVWNYAQAVPHLFPSLERTLRETEFGPSQADTGHQMFRAALPIRPLEHDFHAAADGQLGGILKVHRDWRISGDTEWLRALWPKVTKSLDYCIATWDPRLKGVLEEPHHNTYDIEFWGPNGMCTSFYLGALQAAVRMGEALGADVARYRDLLARGTAFAETDLYNGEYFIQKIQWEGLRAGSPTDAKSMVGEYSPEAIALLKQEGPKYQVRRRLPRRRRPRLVDGAGLRRRPGARSRQGREPPAGRPQAQPAARSVDALEPAAAVVRGRQGRRAADLHLAARRQADAAVRLLGRGVDRHRVPGRVAPDAARPRRPGAGHRARGAGPLRRPRPQPVQRVRVRPLVRAGAGVLRAAAGDDRRALRCRRQGAVSRAARRRRLPRLPVDRDGVRHRRRPRRQAVLRRQGGQGRGARDQVRGGAAQAGKQGFGSSMRRLLPLALARRAFRVHGAGAGRARAASKRTSRRRRCSARGARRST